MYNYYKRGRLIVAQDAVAQSILDGGIPVYDPEAKPQSFDVDKAYHVAAFDVRKAA